MARKYDGFAWSLTVHDPRTCYFVLTFRRYCCELLCSTTQTNVFAYYALLAAIIPSPRAVLHNKSICSTRKTSQETMVYRDSNHRTEEIGHAASGALGDKRHTHD